MAGVISNKIRLLRFTQGETSQAEFGEHAGDIDLPMTPARI